MDALNKVLQKHQEQIQQILPFSLAASDLFELDLSANNKVLSQLDEINTETLSQHIQDSLKLSKSKIAIGGYLEDRLIYRKSAHFGNDENARTIHLGIDLWCDAHTSVAAPLEARVHSFKHNDNFGDYGPTIILEHYLEGMSFFSLYGHLSKASLQYLEEGQIIKAGERFSEIGPAPENGDWPPHLHFQLISDIGNYKGDFPGVCSQGDIQKYQRLCPDPSLLMRL